MSLLAPLARADTSAEIAQASAPLSEGVPEVAVARLQALLNGNLPDAEWCAVAEKLAEAQVAAKEPEDTLVLLADARVRELLWAKFWRAQAFAALNRWADALPLYEKLANDEASPFRGAATFGAAEMLRALGNREAASRKLGTLLNNKEWAIRAQLRAAELHIEMGDAPDAQRLLEEMKPRSIAERRERRLLRGRLELLLQRPERAISMFQALLKRPERAGHATLIAALFGIAEAHLQLKTPEAGDNVIEQFIDLHPADPDLPLLFAKLDDLYRAEHKPSRHELEKWVRRPEELRRTFARWYLARLEIRAGRRERARQLFSDLRHTSIKSPAIAPALLEFAQFEVEDRHFDEAIAILDDARPLHPEPALLARIDFLSAQAHYLAKRFDTATAAFEQIAHSNSPWARVALFNASSGWLHLGNHARFLVDYSELEQQGGDKEARATLRLEEGLMQAAKGDKKAEASLQQFIRDFPKNPRVSEAWVALAELAFHSSPPRVDEARKNLARATESAPTVAAVERADYLSIWVEETASGNETKVIELAKRFLEQHGLSPFAPEVQMKLAELYYRRQDFANAQTQFEIIAQQHPDDSLAEEALFFAAESAMSSMGEHSLDRAIVLFDQVVQKNGALRWSARNEEALIERKLGKTKDALALYDEVLKSDAPQSEKREALCGKGDIFFETGGSENFQRAIEIYDQLASDKNEPSHWRNQALFKKALCLEKKDDRAGALETFYKILDEETREYGQRELFWYYKAGFNAARLLEEDSKWESAAAIYERLAAAGGNRSEEAKARLNHLRLEHFLWAD
ncbi:MAG TPA: tetratricopeptide repeat protein [Candidatus Udaeobacter sp.]|nr:tetratricopeptide repeat protein [Candidatus Udaeobacter sp.]